MVEIPDARMPYPQLIIDGFLSSAHNFTITQEGLENLFHSVGLMIEKISHAGHKKCFIVIAKPDAKMLNKPTVTVDIEDTYHKIRTLYDEIDRLTHYLSGNRKELSTDIYVNSNIYKLKEDYPHTYNIANLSYANTFLEQGKPFESLKFLSEYAPDQPEDANMNYGSFLFIKAVSYRQLGDYVMARKLLKECADYYPKIRKYNYVKDLEIDGLVSNTVFQPYLWWNAERILQDFG